MDSPSALAPARSGSMPLAILVGGLACGVFDFIFAVVYYGAPWQVIARSVARGVVSKDVAYGGEFWVVAAGVMLHLVISLGAAAVFVGASRKAAWLALFPGPAGLAYGMVVYFVMSLVVVPASSIEVAKYPPSVDWGALVGHMALVGLPIALATRWFGPRQGAD